MHGQMRQVIQQDATLAEPGQLSVVCKLAECASNVGLQFLLVSEWGCQAMRGRGIYVVLQVPSGDQGSRKDSN